MALNSWLSLHRAQLYRLPLDSNAAKIKFKLGYRNMMDKLKEECGVFGIFDHEEAARLTYLGLYALQHRGQESAGIVSSDGAQLHQARGMGYVSEIFNQDMLSRLPGQ